MVANCASDIFAQKVNARFARRVITALQRCSSICVFVANLLWTKYQPTVKAITAVIHRKSQKTNLITHSV